ncbi:MAG: twin-arginine translocase TatA/TatE family subunit [Deltaproteobacteria bacterium]|nr:twin-arginine translocase TatA/TatE family subunit [Deltaproteobacteria bacterium]
MFGISMYELGLIALIGLIFLGPRQLTETARVVGRMVRELQKMASDVQKSIDLDIDSPTSSSSYNREPTAPPISPPLTANLDKDLTLPESEKSGPDFYAELLANSAEIEPSSEKDSDKPMEDSEVKKEKEKA